MTKRIFMSIVLGILLVAGVHAQNEESSDEGFREILRSIVSDGNKQYDRSFRPGIKLYADSLNSLLRSRSLSGKLNATDSLEFTADLLKLRADWHYENSNYDGSSYGQAEKLFNEALTIYTNNDEFSHHLYFAPMIHRELAQLYYKQGRYSDALSHISEACRAYASAYDNGDFLETDNDYSIYLDIQSQMAICNARVGNYDKALKQINSILKLYTSPCKSYYEALRKKGKIIMLSGISTSNRMALPYYKQYFLWCKENALHELSTMNSEEREGYWMRIRPFVADCYQLEDADPSFLYNVILFSKGLLLQINRVAGQGKADVQALSTLKYKWEQIQEKLRKDACAVEFMQYEKLGKTLMGGLVLRKTGIPCWIRMISPDDFFKYEINGRTNKERLYSTDGKLKNAVYNDTIFYSIIWNSDLRKAISKCKKVYFAPDGYLHQLAIEYMKPHELANVDLFRLTSTRRLMESSKLRANAALLIGGIKYDSGGLENHLMGNDVFAYSYLKGVHASFCYLPGSLVETDSVLSYRSCPKDTLLVGDHATEYAFRKLCSLYPIISISTHGYFGASEISQGTDIKPCLSDESLSQSVIAFSGANVSLDNQTFDPRDFDGVISARELSSMNMNKVDLAVVSACQTGLGYVTADGVYGIQRGLKNAGVGCLLVSLWNVSDRATCLMMSRFHKNIRGGMPAHKAFMLARASLQSVNSHDYDGSISVFNPTTMSQEIITEDDYDEPQYRNAFIMIDALE
jgi:CHAT domain-containing protein/tetratricopeptide (TPR) repeat protein